jgi:hypothetical protein
MLEVALKYELFGENEKSTPFLNMFLANFEQVQVELGKLETAIMEARNHPDTEIKKKVDDLNEVIKQLAVNDNVSWTTHETRR